MELCDTISFTLTAAGAAYLNECDMRLRELPYVYDQLSEEEMQRLFPADYYEGQVMTMSFFSLFRKFENFSFDYGLDVPFVNFELVESK